MRKIIQNLIKLDKISLLLLFCSVFILTSFSGTRLFFSDEGIILDQFYNLIHGSLALKTAKIDTAMGVLITVGNNLYGVFSYSLLFISLPAFYTLNYIESIYGAHLFILQLWALCGGIIAYLITIERKLKHEMIYGIIAYLILISSNLYFFEPIYFPKWGELLSIEMTNILISSILLLVVFLIFRQSFSQRIGIFAFFFVLLATPISFYAITLKHHSLTILLTILAFYFIYNYFIKKENKFLYFAYISAGLCVWTRTLDGAVLLVSLVISDIFFSKRSIKHFLHISFIILISLLPFFIFNYLILEDPFSIIENTPLTDKNTVLITAKDFISLQVNQSSTKQLDLLNKLGYVWTGNIRGYSSEILGYTLFFRLINTHGIFLVSPFLILALTFPVYIFRKKINLNKFDKFLGLYIAVLFGAYYILYNFFNKNVLMSIIKDTPMELEYRYLLILYLILLYFTLRVDIVRNIIEKKSKHIALIYGILLILYLIYFIMGFPIKFLNIQYNISIITYSSLFILVFTYFISMKGKMIEYLMEKLLPYLIACAMAIATSFLLFYYWIITISYISPSQNLTVLPILNYIIEWMYKVIIY